MKNKIIKNHLFSNYLLTPILLFCFILQLSVQGVVYVNKNATGANNGNSWIDAYTTIQAGIDDADIADEEVWVAKVAAEGTYPEAIIMKSGVKLYGGFNGTETARSQRNWTTNITTINASTARSGSPAYHVVRMTAITNSTIDGFTIKGGNADGGTDLDKRGGGIYCFNINNTNTITNNTISGNSAGDSNRGWGGGIYCYGSSPAITNNTISGNSIGWDGYGGGIYCYGSSPTITNNTITGNSALSNFGSGGGICCESSSSPIITNNTIAGNSATGNGSGIYCDSSSPSITNNTIAGNSAGNYGGGIYCHYSSSPTITNNTISENSAVSGGGILCLSNSDPQIKNTIFSNNNTYDIHEGDTSSDPVVSYNDFYGNPDGVYIDEGLIPYTNVSDMDATIAECSNNIGPNPLFVGGTISGGTWTATPVYNSATFQTTITNSSASWTTNKHAGRLLNPDTTQNKQFVIVSNTSTTINVWGNVTAIAHSGDTYKIFDYHLQLASPCIDAGYDQDVPDIDFDGEPRPMNVLGIDNNGPLAEYDIGADEYPGVRPTFAATVWEFYR